MFGVTGFTYQPVEQYRAIMALLLRIFWILSYKIDTIIWAVVNLLVLSILLHKTYASGPL